VLFRHLTHTQVVMPLDVSAVIVVAPAEVAMRAPGDVAQVRAFVLEVQEPIVLHRGTWHWGPYPIGADSVELFNVQGLRYAEDNEHVDLGALGAPVDVVVP
jgi:ureidoglycolate hydrolase